MTLSSRRSFVAAAAASLAVPSALASPTTKATALDKSKIGKTPHTRFAVNIEMWFTGLPYLKRISASADLGFPAVECWSLEGKDLNAIADKTAELNIEIAQFTAWGFRPGLNNPKNHPQFVKAIEKSCNTYFYTLGSLLDIDQINKWATAFGLGDLSGIDLPHEVQGLMPSTAWKQERHGERWYPGETISVSIGQGQVSVTPISLAVMMATAANGGTRVTPRLLKAVNDGSGWTPVPVTPPRSAVGLQPETVDTLHRGLWMVVNREGTGRRGRILGRDVMGKTGTAQVISLRGREAVGETDLDLRDHGWFVFAAPKDDPQIAGVVFAEHAEHGYLAAPVARHVMETYFAKQEGRLLPTLPLPSRPPEIVSVAEVDNP